MEHELINKLCELAKDSIHGMDISDNGFLLFEFARSFNKPNILELGTCTGQSTIFLALGAKDRGGQVLSVDKVEPVSEFAERKWKYGVEYYIKVLIGDDTNKETINEIEKRAPFDIIFIDTSHEYYHTLQEINIYSKMLKHKGYILMHDSETFDVDKAIHKFITETEGFIIILKKEFESANLTILQKIYASLKEA